MFGDAVVRVFASVPVLTTVLAAAASVALTSFLYKHTPFRAVLAEVWRNRSTATVAVFHVLLVRGPLWRVVIAADAVALLEAKARGRSEGHGGPLQSWALCFLYAAGCATRVARRHGRYREAKEFALGLLGEFKRHQARLAMRSVAGAAGASLFAMAAAPGVRIWRRAAMVVVATSLLDVLLDADKLTRFMREAVAFVVERGVVQLGLLILGAWRCVMEAARRATRRLAPVFALAVERVARPLGMTIVRGCATLHRASQIFWDRVCLPMLRASRKLWDCACAPLAGRAITLAYVVATRAGYAARWAKNRLLVPTLDASGRAVRWIWIGLVVPAARRAAGLASRAAREIFVPLVISAIAVAGRWRLTTHAKRCEALVFPTAVAFVAARFAAGCLANQQQQTTLVLGCAAVATANAALLLGVSAAASPALGGAVRRRHRDAAALAFALYGDLGISRCVGAALEFAAATVVWSLIYESRRLLDGVARQLGRAVRFSFRRVDAVVRGVAAVASLLAREGYELLKARLLAPLARLGWSYAVLPLWNSPFATLLSCLCAAVVLVLHHRDVARVSDACARSVARLIFLASSATIAPARALAAALARLARRLSALRRPLTAPAASALCRVSAALLDFAAPNLTDSSALLSDASFATGVVVLLSSACGAARVVVFDDAVALLRVAGLRPRGDPAFAVAVVRLFVKLALAPLVLSAVLPASRAPRAAAVLFYAVGAMFVAVKASVDSRQRFLEEEERHRGATSDLGAPLPVSVSLAGAFLLSGKTRADDDDDDDDEKTCPVCLETVLRNAPSDGVVVSVPELSVTLPTPGSRTGRARSLLRRVSRRSLQQSVERDYALRWSHGESATTLRLSRKTEAETTELVAPEKSTVRVEPETDLFHLEVICDDKRFTRLAAAELPLAVLTPNLETLALDCDAAAEIRLRACAIPSAAFRQNAIRAAASWAETGEKPRDADHILEVLDRDCASLPCTLACSHRLHFGCLVALMRSNRCLQRCPLCREPVTWETSLLTRLTTTLWF